ncbi:MAG: hypothetical protein ACK5H1_02435 [Tenacibaculum sp.]
MRNLKFLLRYISLIVLLTVFNSCNTKDELNNLKGAELSIDAFFEKISSMDVQSEENAIYIEYTYNKEKETLSLLQAEERELNFFYLLFRYLDSDFEDDKTRSKKKKYKVSCSMGGDGSKNWTKYCSGAYSCGSLSKKCLDAGGCAEICNAQMVYIPAENHFLLLTEEDYINFE